MFVLVDWPPAPTRLTKFIDPIAKSWFWSLKFGGQVGSTASAGLDNSNIATKAKRIDFNILGTPFRYFMPYT
ncbi:MAG: hypothetical protein MUO33_01730, partial [Sedimentisphaerales bacterium]|nr:hypothetical protein [Sedimentisphaerales bacterium]